MKEQLSGRFMGLLVALSSAVGLGNLWKFPTLTGENGGAAFVFTYVIASLIVGIPILIAEFVLGRSTGSNSYDAFRKLQASKAWNVISWVGILSSLMIVIFYTVIIGWVYTYLFKAMTGALGNPTAENLAAQFGEMTSSPVSLGAQMFVLGIIFFILYKGVSKGIEKAVSILAPIFLILILVVLVNSLRLDGFGEAMDFLFSFDISAVNSTMILSAMGLAFFKLTLGSTTMMTYASYFTKDTNLAKTAVTVSLADVGISLIAGIALFPVVFTFGMEPSVGAGLLFNTVPLAFANLPMGNLFVILFFGLAAIVGTMAAVSLLQVTYAVLVDKLGGSRILKTIGLYGFIVIVSVFTMYPFSLFGDVKVEGLVLFDWFDRATSIYLLPLGGMLIALFVGWSLKKEIVHEQLGKNVVTATWKFVLKFVVPVVMTIVILNGLGFFS